MSEDLNIKKIYNFFLILIGLPFLLASSIFCYFHGESVFNNNYFILGFFFSIPSIFLYSKEKSDKNYDETYQKCLEIYSRMEKVDLEKIESKIMSMPNKYFSAEKEAFVKAYQRYKL